MSVYMTEQEQLAAIKKWWGKNQNYLLSFLVLILLIWSAVNFWQKHQYKVNSQASQAFEQLMLAVSQNDAVKINSYTNLLTTNYKGTVYSLAALLCLSKLNVKESQFDSAKKNLATVIKNSKIKSLTQIAKLRLARILLNEKAYDEALYVLDTTSDEAYLPVVYSIKGDILVEQKKYLDAKDFYLQAQEGFKKIAINNSFLEMKIARLENMI